MRSPTTAHESKCYVYLLRSSKGINAETTDRAWLHFGAKENHNVIPLGTYFWTQEGEGDWKQSTQIFLTFSLTAPGDKMTGSVDTDGIYLDYSKAFDTVSCQIPVSKLKDHSLDVRTSSKQPVGWLGSEGHGLLGCTLSGGWQQVV